LFCFVCDIFIELLAVFVVGVCGIPKMSVLIRF